MQQLMMIGFGAMGQTVYQHLPKDIQVKWIVVPQTTIEKIQTLVPSDVQVIASIEDCQTTPDYVIEVAGQAALHEHLLPVLTNGWKIGVISVGAFADTDFYQQAQQTAKVHNASLQILAGAIAGVDGIAAAKEAGLAKVTYQGRKSPNSWRGSYAEELIDLDTVSQATIFFQGSAKEAALKFPANANVAATVALAGLGMDATTVELIVDPNIEKNNHTILVAGDFGEMQIQMTGIPLASNPKTSTLAALSVVRACRNATANVQI